jgi:hypothetical protein
VIDSSEEQCENPCDSIGFNSDSISNEIDESDLQSEKHNEQII